MRPPLATFWLNIETFQTILVTSVVIATLFWWNWCPFSPFGVNEPVCTYVFRTGGAAQMEGVSLCGTPNPPGVGLTSDPNPGPRLGLTHREQDQP